MTKYYELQYRNRNTLDEWKKAERSESLNVCKNSKSVLESTYKEYEYRIIEQLKENNEDSARGGLDDIK